MIIYKSILINSKGYLHKLFMYSNIFLKIQLEDLLFCKLYIVCNCFLTTECTNESVNHNYCLIFKQQALEERASLQSQNSQLQHKLAEYFKKKKVRGLSQY